MEFNINRHGEVHREGLAEREIPRYAQYRKITVLRTCEMQNLQELTRDIVRASWRVSLLFGGGGGQVHWGGGEHSVEDHYHHIKGIIFWEE